MSATRDEDDITLDLALSGGGLRATFFSLGVIMYLLDSNLRGRIRSISSVSGGSITNIALATGVDVATGDAKQLDVRMRRLASELTSRGAFFVDRGFVGFTVILALGLVASIIVVGVSEASFYALLGKLSIATSSLILLVACSWGLRGLHQVSVYRALLYRLNTRTSGVKAGSLNELPRHLTTHVFCATELVSGQPLYMTRSWSYTPEFGAADLGQLALSKALYASAAFPILFPPFRLKVVPNDWTGGRSATRPSSLYLADGGIYNNLGTEWRDALTAAAATSFERFDPSPPPATLQVVVNASAPPKLAEINFILRHTRQFIREVNIMYDSTVRLRIREMQRSPQTTNSVVIDIAEDPLELAERITRIASQIAVGDRAKTVALSLREGRSAAGWSRFNLTAADVKTKLHGIQKDTAADLLQNGYLKASIYFHALLGAPGPDDVPPRSYFNKYVSES